MKILKAQTAKMDRLRESIKWKSFQSLLKSMIL